MLQSESSPPSNMPVMIARITGSTRAGFNGIAG
jgi:hypothetical protein